MPQTLNLRKQPPSDSTPQVVQKPSQPLAARLARRMPDTERHLVPSPQPQGIAWHAPRTYHSHTTGYSVILAAIIAWLAAGWFAWQAQWFAAVVLACAGIAVFVFRKEPSSHRIVHIHETGVVVDDAYYPWNELKSFWIDYHPGSMKELSLEVTHWYRPHVRILLADQDPIAVRNALLAALVPERQHTISLIDFWIKRY